MNRVSNQQYISTIIVLMFIFNNSLNSQNLQNKHAGTYSNHKKYPTTILKLNSNGTFYLQESDYTFFMRTEIFENTGKWSSEKDTVFLNPHLGKLNKNIELTEESIHDFDSIRIQLNYFITEFDQSDFFNIYKFLLTTYEIEIDNEIYFVEGKDTWNSNINKRKNKIKIDSTNSFYIDKKSIKEINVFEYTYGASKTFKIKSPKSNYIRININHEFDKSRNPRNRKIIIKNKKAYMHEYNNKINTSRFALKLKKRKS